jgi:hypothetical protein
MADFKALLSVAAQHQAKRDKEVRCVLFRVWFL